MSTMSALSVISRQMSSGGASDSRRAAATCPGNPVVANVRAETLMETIGADMPIWSNQREHWRIDSTMTQVPSSPISPDCSATEMKCEGRMSPSRGCCQRTSDSTPPTEPVPSSAIGW